MTRVTATTTTARYRAQTDPTTEELAPWHR